MIGWIMVTLVTQWFVIFFEAKEVCADFLVQGDLTDEQFKTRQRWVKTLEGKKKISFLEKFFLLNNLANQISGSFILAGRNSKDARPNLGQGC